jgi:hypothetical protein
MPTPLGMVMSPDQHISLTTIIKGPGAVPGLNAPPLKLRGEMLLSIISGVNGHFAGIGIATPKRTPEQQPQPSASYPCIRTISLTRVSLCTGCELLASNITHAVGCLDPCKSHHCHQDLDQQRPLKKPAHSRTDSYKHGIKPVSQVSNVSKVWAGSEDVTLDVASKTGPRPSAPSPFGQTKRTGSKLDDALHEESPLRVFEHQFLPLMLRTQSEGWR